MVRNVFILVYIIAVLAIAGFARANAAIPLPTKQKLAVTEVAFDPQDFTVLLVARLPNPCTVNPVPYVDYDATQPEALQLKVVAERIGDFCAAVLPQDNEVSVQFGLAALEDEVLRLGLDPNNEYVLKVPGTGFRMIVNFGAQIMEQQWDEASFQQDLPAYLDSYENRGLIVHDDWSLNKQDYNNKGRSPKNPILMIGSPAYP